MDCIFCGIAEKSVPAAIVYEDGETIALQDIHPRAPVHILVIPRQHIPSLAEAEANHAALIAKLIYAARYIAAERGLAGYKLVFNVGRAGGQVIDHLHLHLLGGWEKPEDREKESRV